MLRIGLTGGIGSGKSTVARLLVAHGAALVDTDAIARSLTLAGGTAIESIRSAFGARFIAADGSLDRPVMREAVFGNAGAKQSLEAILHPLIGVEVERQVEAQVAEAVVLDIPLLVEAGRWRARVDRVWVVDCSEHLQVERVVARSGWEARAVQAVIARQAGRAARRAAADAVIDNGADSLAPLGVAVSSLWQATVGGLHRASGRHPEPL